MDVQPVRLSGGALCRCDRHMALAPLAPSAYTIHDARHSTKKTRRSAWLSILRTRRQPGSIAMPRTMVNRSPGDLRQQCASRENPTPSHSERRSSDMPSTAGSTAVPQERQKHRRHLFVDPAPQRGLGHEWQAVRFDFGAREGVSEPPLFAGEPRPLDGQKNAFPFQLCRPLASVRSTPVNAGKNRSGVHDVRARFVFCCGLASRCLAISLPEYV